MLLSQLVQKPIVVDGNIRGVCLGVGISLKNYAVKYLLCSSSPTRAKIDFCVNVSSILKIDEAVFLRRLRPVFPKNCAQITMRLPIFSFNGGALGFLRDLEMQNLVALRFFNENQAFPICAITACSDAVILRKEQAYPLGQRVPAPFLLYFKDVARPVVTKAVLSAAIKKKSLIKLTLSLPPFSLDILPAERKFKD